MGLANVAYNASFTWADRRTRSLEEQAKVPMFNERPVELGVSGNEREILSRLAEDRRYPTLFRGAFPDDPDPIRLENIIRAVASFERTLVSGNSPYDRLVYHDEQGALSDSARRGMGLFFSEPLACSGCHAGFNFSGPIAFDGVESMEPTFHNTGLYGAYPELDRGLFDKTGKRRHRGRFRAPSLRNVELTAPYMHDGSVDSLRRVIEIYSAGGRHRSGDGRVHPNKSERITGFSIDEQGIEDLLAFLRSLTDEMFVRNPRFGDPFRAGSSGLHALENRLGASDDL
jgi:cytochrome c peroxidase